MTAAEVLAAIEAAVALVKDLVALGRDPAAAIAAIRDADPELARIHARRQAEIAARFGGG